MKGGTERKRDRDRDRDRDRADRETNLRFAALLAQAVLFNGLQGFDT